MQLARLDAPQAAENQVLFERTFADTEGRQKAN